MTFPTASQSARCFLRLNEKNDDDGFTALMVASKNGHVCSVRLLLAEDGIQINETCAKRSLFYAAKGNHEHVVGQILSHGRRGRSL